MKEMKIYHMAKKGVLKKGDILKPRIVNDINCMNPVMSRQIQDYYNEQFPNGVCNHGEMYFAYGSRATYLHPFTELILEKARRGIDSNLPSRANAIFAIENPQNFSYLCSLMKLDYSEMEIWEVESNYFIKADMFLLDRIQSLILNEESILVISKLADDYWKGNSVRDFIENDESFWEYLMQPPILIKEKYLLI